MNGYWKMSIVFVLFCLFCFFSWHSVENSINADLRQQLQAEQNKLKNQKHETQEASNHLAQYHTLVKESCPESADDFDVIYETVLTPPSDSTSN